MFIPPCLVGQWPISCNVDKHSQMKLPLHVPVGGHWEEFGLLTVLYSVPPQLGGGGGSKNHHIGGGGGGCR